MSKRKPLSRAFLLFALLTLLCAGIFTPRVEEVKAKPVHAADKVSVLISEFRTRGPGGADDEFVEIYNATASSVTLTNWKIRKSSGCGTTLADLATINTTLAPGQYYLIGKSPEYTGSTSLDQVYSSSTSIADDGGIALVDNIGNIVDQVGMCSTTTYKEFNSSSPLYLSDLTTSVEQSYERKNGASAGNCKDTDNNYADFSLNSSSSNPQNFSTSPLPCLVVTNVLSTDGTYTPTQNVDITITFNNSVNVIGTPTLLLETGLTDRNATYISGDGTNSLLFRYTVVAGDSSGDLNYLSANALALNGGAITGAIGDATLILPQLGQAGSLGFNNNIIIDNGVAPTLLSFQRQTPVSSSTNANSLVFRATFSEAVTGVDILDFVATGTTGTPTTVAQISGNIYDVTVSGGDLPGFNGVVGLNLSASSTITDTTSNPLPIIEPTIDETYTVDNISPSVTINQGGSQPDPAGVLPVNFAVVFSEPINPSTFVPADITQSGTAGFITWTITNSGDNMNFTLSAIASGNGTLIPSIAANRVTDLAGNNNTASTSTDNIVTLNDVTAPTVTINQATGQLDPTSVLPISFTIVFSEIINPSVFTTSDITQSGTATGITWSIINSGDNKTFTLSATAVTGFGTLVPSIAANRVTDWAGNNNSASTSTDNSVNFLTTSTFTPTRTRTPTITHTPTITNTPSPATVLSILINEVAWAGTSSARSSDEWIELYNTESVERNLNGWRLTIDDGTTESAFVNFSSADKILPGNFFILAHSSSGDYNIFNNVIEDKEFTGSLSNSGPIILRLYSPQNVLIDTANNGKSTGWYAGTAASTYSTMERKGKVLDAVSAWQTFGGTPFALNRDNASVRGTPKRANSVLAAATATRTRTPVPGSTAVPVVRPIINEFLARPGFDWNQDGSVDVFDEFIEIKNIGVVDVNLSGWRLDDEANQGSNPFTLPSVTLKPGERIVFYGLQTNILLSDGGDTVRLLNPSNKIYDSYTYKIAKVEDESVCRLVDGHGDWYEDCTPTPTFTNTRDGETPSMPDGSGFESPVCNLPDTLPEAFLIAECRGYGANLWSAIYWDAKGWETDRFVPENMSKWESFVE